MGTRLRWVPRWNPPQSKARAGSHLRYTQNERAQKHTGTRRRGENLSRQVLYEAQLSHHDCTSGWQLATVRRATRPHAAASVLSYAIAWVMPRWHQRTRSHLVLERGREEERKDKQIANDGLPQQKFAEALASMLGAEVRVGGPALQDLS